MHGYLVRRPARPSARSQRAAHGLQWTPLVWYFVLAYTLTWAWWLPLALTGRVVDAGWRPMHLPGELGPFLAAIIVTGATSGWSGVRDLAARMVRWRIVPRWWLATFSPLAFFVVAAPLVRAVGGNWPAFGGFDRFAGAPAIGVVGVWLILIATTGFGEAVGWRGYAIPYLQERYRPLAASLIVAVFWMVWHIPAFFFNQNYQGMNVAMLPGFFLGIAVGSIVLTWHYNRSGSSQLAVAIWHGSYDLVSGTKAAEGGIAIVVTALVMVLAVRIAVQEVRAQKVMQ